MTPIIVTQPAGGTVVVQSGLTVIYTPNGNFTGTDSFTYRLVDRGDPTGALGNAAQSAPATVTITVSNPNDAPVAALDSLVMTVNETLTIPVANLLANDTDPDGNTLTVVSVAAIENGVVSLANGVITFTPTAAFIGTARFSYTISDGTLTSSAEVRIAVEPFNAPPVVGNDTVSGSEDTPLAINFATLVGNDSDPEGQPLAIVEVRNATGGTATLDLVNGRITFTPAANLNGNGAGGFDYVTSDGSRRTTGRVTVNLAPVNDNPVAVADSHTTAEDTPLVIPAASLLTNDTDIDGNTLSVTGVGNATSGTVVLAAGQITFTPAANFSGSAGFDYTISDGQGGTSTGRVTVTVTPVNDAPVAVDDAVSTSEDTTLSIAIAGLLTNDTDLDGNPISLTGVANATGGTAIIQGNQVVFTPAANFSGAAGFDYTISDGQGGNDVGRVTITVTPINDAPVVVGEARSILSSETITLTYAELLANDSDIEGSTLTVTGVSNATGGTLSTTATGVTFTPTGGFTGVGGFDYTVSDGALITIGRVTINVNQANRAPVAVADAASVAEDQPLVLAASALTANDTDADADTLTVTSVGNASQGTVSLSGGQVTFNPSANFNGTAGFDYTISDGRGGTSTGRVTVTVTPVHDPVIARPLSVTTNEDNSIKVSFASLTTAATNIDGGLLTFVTAFDAVGGTLDICIPCGHVEFIPTPNFNGVGSFKFTIRDASGAESTSTVTVTVQSVADAPVAVADSYAVDEDGMLVVPVAQGVLANDTDADGDTLSSGIVSGVAHGTLTLNPDGSFTYTPDADFSGTDSFVYRASDGALTSGDVAVTIIVNPVNDNPVAVADSRSTAEDTPLVIPAASLLTNDTDIDGNPLSVTGVSNPANGTVVLAAGQITFTPAANFNGTAGFDYTISDGQGGTSTGRVTVTVTPVNDVPTANAVTATAVSGQTRVIQLSGFDIETPELTAVIVTQPAGGNVTIQTGLTAFYTPNVNFTGTDIFTYFVVDRGDPSGSIANARQSAPATVTITVVSPNSPPVVAGESFGITNLQTLSVTFASLLANDTDVDGDGLSVTGTSNVTGGTLATNATGVVFTPTTGFIGTAGFDYAVSDGQAQTTGRVTINVTTPDNRAPVAVADSYALDEDGTLVVPAALGVLANDTDADGDTLSSGIVSGVAHGTLTLNPDGSFTYTPDANFAGTDTFVYRASDGALTSGNVAVTITIIAVNDAPVAVDDNPVIAEDTPLVIAASSLVANDTDADGNPLSVTDVSNPANGTVVLDAGQITFTPAANFNGTAGFDYTISDGQGGTSTGRVIVTVTPVNDNPVAVADSRSTAEDTPLVIPADSLLTNDTDIDGNPLSVTGVSNPANGTVVLAAGQITFTPAANFNGTAGFDYTISDGQGGTSTGRVTVTVTPVNDVPVVAGESFGITNLQTLSVTFASLLANDTDIDGDGLSVTGTSSVTGGTLATNATGVVFTPTAGFTGTAGFDYAVSDGQAQTTGHVTINVTAPDNRAPVAVADSYAVDEDGMLVVPVAQGVLANDTDADGDTLSSGIVSGVAHGTLTLNPDGSFTYTPDADFSGTDSFVYRASDGALTSGDVAVTIIVNPVNDNPVAVADSRSTAEDTPLVIPAASLLTNDTDIDGNPLSVTGVSNPANGTVVLAAGQITFTPAANFNGTAGFDYTISDGQGGTSTGRVTVTVTPVNDVPTANAVTATAVSGQTRVIQLSGFDIETPELTAVIVTQPAGGNVTIQTGLTAFYTPNVNFTGTDIFTYFVVDRGDPSGSIANARQSAPATVTITVVSPNSPPVVAGESFGITNLQTLSVTFASLLANDTDVDGDGLSVTGTSNVTGGTLATNATGVVFTPTTGFIGTAGFDYAVSDGQAQTTGRVTINVASSANRAPRAIAETIAEPFDGSRPAIIAASRLLANDRDPDGDTMQVISAFGAVNGSVSYDAVTKLVTFTPTAGYLGPAMFEYAISDGQLVSSARVRLFFADLNDAPVGVADSLEIDANTTVQLPVAQLLANDSDPEGDTLNFLRVTAPTNLSVSYNAVTGLIAITPPYGYAGPASFRYVVSDGINATTVTVNVTVRPGPAAAPIVANEQFNAIVGRPVTLTFAQLLGNDRDPNGDVLTITGVSGATLGNVAIDTVVRTVTYTATQAGTGRFSYTVSDGSLSTAGVVTMVNRLATQPIVTGENIYGRLPGPVILSVASLLANDRDENGLPLTITRVVNGLQGTVRLEGDQIIFTPTAGTAPLRTFQYAVSNGVTETLATVNLRLVENNAPVVRGNSFATNRNAPLVTTAAALLANDSDADGDALVVTRVESLVGGTVAFDAATGVILFTPTTDFVGPALFAYFVSDGRTEVRQTVQVQVVPVSESSAPINIQVSIAANTPFEISFGTLVGTGLNADGLLNVFRAIENTSGGTATIDLSRQVVIFRPTMSFTGQAVVTFSYFSGAVVKTGTLRLLVAEAAQQVPEIAGAAGIVGSAAAISDPVQAWFGEPEPILLKADSALPIPVKSYANDPVASALLSVGPMPRHDEMAKTLLAGGVLLSAGLSNRLARSDKGRIEVEHAELPLSGFIDDCFDDFIAPEFGALDSD